MWLKCFISVFVLNTLLTAKVFWVWFSFTFSVILLVSNPKMIRTSGHVNRCHVRTDNWVLDRGISQNVSDIQDNNSILSTRCTLHSFRKLSVFMVGLLHVSWLPIMTCILYIHEIILNLNIYYPCICADSSQDSDCQERSVFVLSSPAWSSLLTNIRTKFSWRSSIGLYFK